MAETDSSLMTRGTGRRKTAVARVRITANGEGNVLINQKQALHYLGRKALEMVVRQPLEVTGSQRRFDVSAKVEGGGVAGQAGAVAHGIARALIAYDAEMRGPLKKAGLLTRDSRMKERKKPGLKRARKAPQYTKR